MADRESFLLYKELREPVELLSLENRGRLLDAILTFQCGGSAPADMPREVALVFATVKARFDRDRQRYQDVCDSRREAGRKGGLARMANASEPSKSSNCFPGQANQANQADMRCYEVKCLKENLPSEGEKKMDLLFPEQQEDRAEKPKTFRKPSLEEVAAYCKERGNCIDPSKFTSHYQSNGWRVGKNPMRDWKAAVRTWEQGQNQQPQAAWSSLAPKPERRAGI